MVSQCLWRALLSFAISLSFTGCHTGTDTENDTSLDGPKLAALRKLVALYHASPNEYASDKERYRFNDSLQALQHAFKVIPFDVSQHRQEAIAIVTMWQKELEGRYSGQLPDELENEIVRIYEATVDAE